MRQARWPIVCVPICILLIGLCVAGCGGDESRHAAQQQEEPHGSEEFARGPHRGRVLACGQFSLELTLFELGGAPRMRLYGTSGKNPISPGELRASVTLRRLGGVSDSLSFVPVADFLESRELVYEPHSFDVDVTVVHDGTECAWSFASYEARTTIPAEVAQRVGIRAERVTAHEVASVVRARGKVLPSEHRIAHVIPRFAGIVREGRKHVGDSVEKGEVVAIIESNQSLQPFDVKAQISGTVINGHLVVGEFVPDSQWIYIVADLSVVWADLFVSLREGHKIAVGQEVTIASVNTKELAFGRVMYLAPYADEKSQSRLVRVELANPNGQFLPGAHVTGDILVEKKEAPIAVRREALQRYNQWTVVFIKVGDTYEARPVEVGQEDDRWVEVLSGLTGNEEYVFENAFLVKADILKSGASHDH